MMTKRNVSEDDRIKLANIFTDTNHDARFESMRKNTRSARVLRRHEDLRKQCEKEVRTYERWQKLAAAELRQSQTMYLDRLKKFQKSLAQPAFFHRSKANVANLTQSPREVSSANSVPHYVRYRGSPRPTNPDPHMSDNEDTHRSHTSVGQHSMDDPLSDALKIHSKKVVSKYGHLNHSPRTETKSQVPSLSLSLQEVEQVGERLPVPPSSIPGTPRIGHESPPTSARMIILSATPTPRSTTSLPRLTQRALSGTVPRTVYNPCDNTTTEIVDVQELRPKNGHLLFSVRKQNGEETYIQNKKKTVTFHM